MCSVSRVSCQAERGNAGQQTGESETAVLRTTSVIGTPWVTRQKTAPDKQYIRGRAQRASSARDSLTRSRQLARSALPVNSQFFHREVNARRATTPPSRPKDALSGLPIHDSLSCSTPMTMTEFASGLASKALLQSRSQRLVCW